MLYQSVYEDDEYVYLVMELCTGGPLLDRMTKRKMTEKDVAHIVRSILQFIAQCHAKVWYGWQKALAHIEVCNPG